MNFARLNLLFAVAAAQSWNELWRPQFHQSTPLGWGNDPNGMVFDGHRYHLFYQHYPYDTVWGPMHWGHSSSTDLLTWDHHEVAIKPVGIRDQGDVFLEIDGTTHRIPEDEWPRVGQAFSGSAFLDKEGRFNVGSNTIILMWTEHTEITDPVTYRRERQSMAYLLESEGYSTVHYWDAAFHGIQNEAQYNMEYYDGDTLKEPAAKESDIRDPKFVKYNDETQLAIVANCDRMVIYSAPLGRTVSEWWTPRSAFGVNNGKIDTHLELSTHDPTCANKGRTEGIWGGLQGGVWECPDLIRMTVEGTDKELWVMIVSIGENQGLAVNDGPNTGSATMYFVGEMNSDFQFIPVESFDAYPKWIDYGPDSYAGVTYDNTSPPLFQAWMSNWLYANHVPTGQRGWRSGMTLPRELRLVNLGSETDEDYRVAHKFIDLTPLHDDVVSGTFITLPGFGHSQSIHTVGMELVVEFSGITLESEGSFTVRFSATAPIELPTAEILDFVEVGLYIDAEGTQEFRVERSSTDRWTGDAAMDKAYGHYKDASVARAPRIQTEKTSLQIHVVFDTASVEVLFDDGLVSMTSLSFPLADLTRMSVKGTSGMGNGWYAALHSTVYEHTTSTPYPTTTSPTTTTPPPTTTTEEPTTTTEEPTTTTEGVSTPSASSTEAPTCPVVTCPTVTCPSAPTCDVCDDSSDAIGLMTGSSLAVISAAALYLIA